MFPDPVPSPKAIVALTAPMGGVTIGEERALQPFASPPTSLPKHPGGAPPKDFWPDLWIAIAAQLYNGELQPTRQADIEEAMPAWGSNHGKKLSEATARRHAPKLWNLLKREGS